MEKFDMLNYQNIMANEVVKNAEPSGKGLTEVTFRTTFSH